MAAATRDLALDVGPVDPARPESKIAEQIGIGVGRVAPEHKPIARRR
ncbi:hypothetical protein ACFYWS_10420 [Streptomyces sp. NPDC002795]